ncbi:MAG: hypothetical protein HC915_17025 [Anaerolineae bacterium]|nr:hypothetical protein [Anaerolineae bacterium]
MPRRFVAHRLVFRLGERAFTIQHPNAMRVFDRAEFDAALARAVEQCGVPFQANTRVQAVEVLPSGVRLLTDQGIYEAEVLVAADGANSTIRRKLQMRSTVGIARLLRALTPLEPLQSQAWQEGAAVFDFSCVPQGIQGYMWDFPCYINGQPHMNRGIMDSRIAPETASERQHGNLKQTFLEGLDARQVDAESVQLEGHPVRWFNRDAIFSQPHVLLAGDAAGVDPLFAEGISYAMEYGWLVTQAIKHAFATQDFSFRQYKTTLLQHRMGQMLLRRGMVAKGLYPYRYPFFWTIVWALADMAAPPLQRRFGAALALLPE